MASKPSIPATESHHPEAKEGGLAITRLTPHDQPYLENELHENKPLLQNCTSSIIDLPEEVKKNLVGYGDMELDEYLLAILRQYQGHISVDRIILKLWGDFKQSPARAKVLARLRLLDEAGHILKQEGTKGNYTLNREK